MLKKWMRRLLRFGGVFNLVAGSVMLFTPHFTYSAIGMSAPQIDFPIQLVGILVALFGVGYHLVASRPGDNRDLLVLGFWSKALGSVLATYYVVRQVLPLQFVAVYFFADVIYLPFFYLIIRRIDQVRKERAISASPTSTASA